jgi:MFS family permease
VTTTTTTTGTTTAAPSPYAPGKLPDEPAVARPAGRAIVFLWAIAAWAVTGPETLRPWAFHLFGRHPDGFWENAFVFAFGLPVLLEPVFGYLCDRVPLMGTRREGYLLTACLLSAGAWLLVVVAPKSAGPWLAMAAALSLGSILGTVATNGAVAEIAQRRAATGRLGAAVVALHSGTLALTLLWFPLVGGHLGRTAAQGAGFMVSVVLAIVFLSHETADAAPPVARREPARLGPFLRSRAFWVVVAIEALANVTRTGIRSPDAAGSPSPSTAELAHAIHAGTLGTVLAAGAYALLCRRLRPRVLLPACLLVAAAGRAVLGPWNGGGMASMGLSHLASGFAYAASADLVLRACQPGREAFTYTLLVIPGNLFLRTLYTAAKAVEASAPGTRAVAAGAGVLAAAMVVLVPRDLLAAPDRPPPDRAA